MPDDLVPFRIELQFTNKRAMRAMSVILETLEDIQEDFEYRQDVRRAIKAANYVMRHVKIAEARHSP